MKNLIARLRKIKPSTYIRTAALLLAIGNQVAHEFGASPLAAIPILSDQELYGHISWAITALAGLAAWWNNNSFTGAALKADTILAELRSNMQENEEIEPIS